MIIFLTLCYAAVLFLLIRVRILPNALWIKLTPIVWLLLLNVVLFIPMQFAAPAGTAIVWQPVTLMSSRVSGPVQEVFIKANEPLKAGDKLLQIDPKPYELEVRRLEAALVEAESAVPQLKAGYEAATAGVSRAKDQLRLAEEKADRNDRLLRTNALSREDYDVGVRNLSLAKDGLREAEALAEKARLAWEAKTPEGENVTVAQLKAQLAKARYDLDQTVIRAPADGRVVNLLLQEGSSMSVAAGNPMLVFVPRTDQYVIASIQENFLRHVRPDQEVEVALAYQPGRVLRGRVEQVITVTGEGVFSPASNNLPEVAKLIRTGGRFAVRIKLEEGTDALPVGAGGTAAIYTEVAKPTHVIRKVMLRMEAWMNYVF